MGYSTTHDMGAGITRDIDAGIFEGMGSGIRPGTSNGTGADNAGGDCDDGRSDGSGGGSTTVPYQSTQVSGLDVPGLLDREPATSR